MQHAVDTEANDADFTPRLDVDVARALFERVLPEPIDDIDDVLVVGVELAIGPAEFDELLERRQVAALAAELGGLLDRAREIVELDQIARDIDRIGENAANVLLDDRRISFSQSRRNGCVVATSTSRVVTLIGRMPKRVA
jgi:hypothetical protein